MASNPTTTPLGETDGSAEVSTLELFFDLVFVFGFIQVTIFMSENLSVVGIARGLALLGILWWGWVTYSWLTDAIPTDDSFPERLLILTAATAMFVVAVAVPGAFGADALLFGVAYFLVRVIHVSLYALDTGPETRQGIRRLAPGFLGGPALLVVAAFLDGPAQGALWVIALFIDYGIPYIRGNEGFYINAEHFVERYRLIVIIALGEVLIEMGFGVSDLVLDHSVVLGLLFGMVFVITMWWLYFDYLVSTAECRLVRTRGHERAVRALTSYSYVHFLLIAGIILAALGIEETLAHLDNAPELLPAAALYGGGALYLFGRALFQYRETGTTSRLGVAVGIGACVLIPVSVQVPRLVALGGIAVLFVGLVVYEVVVFSPSIPDTDEQQSNI